MSYYARLLNNFHRGFRKNECEENVGVDSALVFPKSGYCKTFSQQKEEGHPSGAPFKRTLFLPKATCVCLFPLVHGHGEIAVGLRAKAADQFAHGRDARRAEKADLGKRVQILNHGFKSAIHLANGAVHMRLDRHHCGGTGLILGLVLRRFCWGMGCAKRIGRLALLVAMVALLGGDLGLGRVRC